MAVRNNRSLAVLCIIILAVFSVLYFFGDDLGLTSGADPLSDKELRQYDKLSEARDASLKSSTPLNPLKAADLDKQRSEPGPNALTDEQIEAINK